VLVGNHAGTQWDIEKYLLNELINKWSFRGQMLNVGKKRNQGTNVEVRKEAVIGNALENKLRVN
jgi:hypothetical protein